VKLICVHHNTMCILYHWMDGFRLDQESQTSCVCPLNKKALKQKMLLFYTAYDERHLSPSKELLVGL